MSPRSLAGHWPGNHWPVTVLPYESASGFSLRRNKSLACESVPMGASSTSPQIPQNHKKKFSERLGLGRESALGRLFRLIFGRPLATAEQETLKGRTFAGSTNTRT
jgi:hypothetical protein